MISVSLISEFLRLFVTKSFSYSQSIWISTFAGIGFTSLAHLVIVIYIVTYILPDKKRMEKILKFIKDHRDS